MHAIDIINRLLHQYVSSDTSNSDEACHRHTLRIASFLFGDTIDDAIEILDRRDSITACVGSFSKFMFLVKPSKPHRGSRRSSVVKPPDKKVASHHFCIVSQPVSTEPPTMYFCSCQLFARKNEERSKVDIYLCEHLLAIRLLPLLNVKPAQRMFSSHELAMAAANATE